MNYEPKKTLTKKSILVLITILFATLIYGRSVINDSNRSDTNKYPKLTTINQNPQILIVIDSKSIKLENFNNYDIKLKWIESVVVHNDAISKQIYGKNGVIFIYSKQKYRKRVLKEIRKSLSFPIN